MKLEIYRGERECRDVAPATSPWRRVGWGSFAVGGRGVWIDFWPKHLVVALKIGQPKAT